jgi:hypothetical protein
VDSVGSGPRRTHLRDGESPLPPRLAATADELVAGAEHRERLDPEDGKSGSSFEHVVIGDTTYFLKQVSYSGDWLMRVAGDRDYRTFKIWKAGVMDAAPPSIDHAVVGMALEGSGPDAVLSVLMRDVGQHLIPPGDEPISTEQHERFIDHLAELGATMWGWRDRLGLKSMRERLRFFAPETIAPELSRDDTDPVIEYADEGWRRLAERRPQGHRLLRGIHLAPEQLETALATTPATFLHGDWKMGNLGAHPDGRTILLDWAYPGSGPACWDLAWILALNRARLPSSKEATIDSYRAALVRHGIATEGWFDTQLDLCLLGMTATMGWEKALGDDEELDWWLDRCERALRRMESI